MVKRKTGADREAQEIGTAEVEQDLASNLGPSEADMVDEQPARQRDTAHAAMLERVRAYNEANPDVILEIGPVAGGIRAATGKGERVTIRPAFADGMTGEQVPAVEAEAFFHGDLVDVRLVDCVLVLARDFGIQSVQMRATLEEIPGRVLDCVRSMADGGFDLVAR